MTTNGKGDQLVVAFSDIEMGAGGIHDDFPHPQFLAREITRYADNRYKGKHVDLVFNGDTFDFLKVDVKGAWPTLVTAKVAIEKLEKIIKVHRAFFVALRQFLKRGAPSGVHFVVGNHDQELLFREVQQRILKEIDAPGVSFPGVAIDIGDAHFEHGSQADPLFEINPAAPMVMTSNGPVLALPWGSLALLDVALPLREYLFALDRIKPRNRVFELLPEVRDLLVGAFWDYWTGVGWRDWISGHPVKRVSWTMLKEIAYRFRTLNPDVQEGAYYRDMLLADDRYRLVVTGHLHQSGWWTSGDKKLITTGCFRDEFTIDREGNVTAPIPKTYAEVFLRHGRTVRSHLVELDGPPAPNGHVPSSIFEVLTKIRPLLPSQEERAQIRGDESAQSRRESRPE